MLAQCVHEISTSSSLIGSLFLGGLVGSASHCTAMCGPFVLSQSTSGGATGLKRLSEIALVPYHLGRMTTYVGLAVLFSSVLNLAFLFLPVRNFVVAPLLMLAGVIFFVNAFPGLLNVFPWAGRIRISVPYRFISGAVSKLSDNPGPFKRYGLGVLLGFIPCGLVVSALMAASTAQSALGAAFAMGAFALGTIPALILTAAGGHTIKALYPRAAQKMAQVLMVCSGLWLFAMAGWMLM